jgi:hypothetical protein
MMSGQKRPKEASNDETAEPVHDLVMCDRRRDLLSIVRGMGISFGPVQAILTDVYGMSKVTARLVPKQLTDDQKRTKLDISRYLCLAIVNQDETWVHHLDPESKKKQSMQWKHPGLPPPKKSKRCHQQGRLFGIVWG